MVVAGGAVCVGKCQHVDFLCRCAVIALVLVRARAREVVTAKLVNSGVFTPLYVSPDANINMILRFILLIIFLRWSSVLLIYFLNQSRPFDLFFKSKSGSNL